MNKRINTFSGSWFSSKNNNNNRGNTGREDEGKEEEGGRGRVSMKRGERGQRKDWSLRTTLQALFYLTCTEPSQTALVFVPTLEMRSQKLTAIG